VVDSTTPEIWIDPSIEEPLGGNCEKHERYDGDDQDIRVYVHARDIPCRPGQSADADHCAGYHAHRYDMHESTMDDQAQIHEAVPNDGVADHGDEDQGAEWADPAIRRPSSQ
jgi:hypothetical protein